MSFLFKNNNNRKKKKRIYLFPFFFFFPLFMSDSVTYLYVHILCRVCIKCHQYNPHTNKNITKTRLFKYTENFTTEKKENFDIKNSDIFYISAQNIDCGYSLELPRQGGSNEYPQSMFLSRNKKNNVYPCKPQFSCIKVGFKGVKTI